MNIIRRVILSLILSLVTAINSIAAISGTFIQPWLAASWDDSRWQQEYATLTEAGFDTLIYMQSVSTDKDGNSTATYPSQIDGVAPADTDRLELCLSNAQKCGFKVIVGLNFDERWWDLSCWTPEWITEQMLLGNKVAAEITAKYQQRYPDTFAGWYWCWEIEDSYLGALPELIDHLVAALNINLDCLHALTPGLPVMLSPFMNSQHSTPEKCAAVWQQILTKADFCDGDILAPQDCVGSGFLKLDETASWFKALRDVLPQSPSISLYANIESFDQRFWTSAPLDRINTQVGNASPYVTGMITFAYSHYYSPERITPALHEAYCRWAETGKLPRVATPEKITTLSLATIDGATLLNWTYAPSAPGLMGYHIYKDGNLVGDCQKLSDSSFDISKSGHGTYTVIPYNVIGQEAAGNDVSLIFE